jgi:hypothetical protein|tara:strand:- start:625 stop:816 length:192 start_codon:yes stop_codon:yes gene_type:complete
MKRRPKRTYIHPEMDELVETIRQNQECSRVTASRLIARQFKAMKDLQSRKKREKYESIKMWDF